MPRLLPPNVTVTAAGLNFSCAVEAMTSVSPPFGVVLDSAPVNALGSPETVTVSVKPAACTCTQEGAGVCAVTTARVDVAGMGW